MLESPPDIADFEIAADPPETVASRVARGWDSQSHDEGAIVPFPPNYEKRLLSDALTGSVKKEYDKLTAAKFLCTPYYYRDEDGRIVQAVLRFDHPNHAKKIKPVIHMGGHRYWFRSIEGQRPLYNLHKLCSRPDAPVLLVEGEKAANSAEKLFPEHVVTTWMSGASSAHRTEMTPLAGRDVVMWPDNDDAGRGAARAVAALVLAAGARSFRIVPVPEEFPQKWDLADPVPEDVLKDSGLEQLLVAASEVHLSDLEEAIRGDEYKAARNRLLGHKAGYSKVDVDAIRLALDELDAGMTRLGWLAVGRCLYHALAKQGLAVFDEWSRTSDEKYREGETESLWQAFAEERTFTGPPVAWLLRRAYREARANKRTYEPSEDAMMLAEIEQLNENHAVITRGGKTVVLWERYDPVMKRFQPIYLGKREFTQKYVKKVRLPAEEATKAKPIRQLGDLWFNSAWRRQYQALAFAPGTKLKPSELNLWTGFAFDPTDNPAGWQLLKDHLLNNVCAGDTDAFEYILNWMAFSIQRLDAKVGTALILVGPKGSGKSILTKLFGRLFGSHTFVTSHQGDITGRFNGHLETTLLLGVEEAFAPQDRAGDGVLKDLITRDELRLEDKFFSVWTARNHLRIIMTSNSDHVVRADLHERRYAVFEVANFEPNPEIRMRYFGKIVNQMKNGGFDAMLGELLARDVRAWNPEEIPETAALRAQKIANLVNDPVVAWYYERLADGVEITTGLWRPDAVRHKWSPDSIAYVRCTDVIEDITGFAKARGLNFTHAKIAGKLRPYMPKGFESVVCRTPAEGRPVGPALYRAYPFPSIVDARRLFTAATGLVFPDDVAAGIETVTSLHTPTFKIV